MIESLPNLSTLPPIVLQGDPDGVRERAAFALLRCDIVGAARLALTIQNPYRRAVWVRGFRPATLAAAHCQSETRMTPAQPAEGKRPGENTSRAKKAA